MLIFILQHSSTPDDRLSNCSQFSAQQLQGRKSSVRQTTGCAIVHIPLHNRYKTELCHCSHFYTKQTAGCDNIHIPPLDRLQAVLQYSPLRSTGDMHCHCTHSSVDQSCALSTIRCSTSHGRRLYHRSYSSLRQATDCVTIHISHSIDNRP